MLRSSQGLPRRAQSPGASTVALPGGEHAAGSGVLTFALEVRQGVGEARVERGEVGLRPGMIGEDRARGEVRALDVVELCREGGAAVLAGELRDEPVTTSIGEQIGQVLVTVGR